MAYRAPEGVGLLPGADDQLHGPFTSTFAILSKPVTSDELCHFCLSQCNEDDEEDGPYANSITVIKLSCCGHHVHTKCFLQWSYTCSLNDNILRCAYCRAVYKYEKRCFLCLDELGDLPLKYTSCCNSMVHSDCAEALVSFCQTHLTSEYTLECGQLHPCCCLWKAA